jgi:hypothetical protein
VVIDPCDGDASIRGTVLAPSCQTEEALTLMARAFRALGLNREVCAPRPARISNLRRPPTRAYPLEIDGDGRTDLAILAAADVTVGQ